MTTTQSVSSGVTDNRKWIALVVVCLAMLMNALDSSIVNVALPSIQRDLHFSPSNLTWVVDAYLIAFGSFLLLAGRLGDLLGRKKVFLSGVALFTTSSVVCALAQNQAMLITARFFQGMGGAISTSVIVAIIVTEFSGAAERAKAMSAYMFVAVGGGSIGLLVGGILTQAVNWHWIFVINVPIGLLTLVLGSMLIKENAGLGVREGLDVTGSLLMTSSLIVGIYAVVKASAYGWTSLHTIGFAVLSFVLMSAFITFESRIERPIMPMRILKLRSLTASSVVRGLTFSSMFAVFFFGALYLEKVLGYAPLQTGIAFLPMTLAMAIMSLGVTSRRSRLGHRERLHVARLVGGAGRLRHPGDQPDHVARDRGRHSIVRVSGGLSRDVPHWRVLCGVGIVGDGARTASAGQRSRQRATLRVGRLRHERTRPPRERVLEPQKVLRRVNFSTTSHWRRRRHLRINSSNDQHRG
jgi:EmrB/QacA subfamily drug resistance transporter